MAIYSSKPRLFKSTKARFVLMMSLILIVLVLIALVISRPPISPIPKSILASVSFPIYYPNNNRLPAGFNLNKASIQYVKPGVVIFNITYPGNQNIVISQEKKPSKNVISHFTSAYIPLHITFNTPNGLAYMGAYTVSTKSLQSVVSLPLYGGTWLIATAPGHINALDYEKVIDSLITN